MQVPADSTAMAATAMTVRNGLFIALGIFTAGYLVVLSQAFRSLAISIVSFMS